jgi:lipoyl(octanoyl) transferase
MKPGWWIDLGRRAYRETWALQKRLVARRQAGDVPDLFVTVEHDDVITLGRRAGARSNILEVGMDVVEVERGGDVTYHGPGQLVGYPIVALDASERDLHAYLRALEDALIAIAADYGVAAARNPGWTGAWVGPRKLASIGVAVRRWVTMHGFALNVSTDLERFTAIHPCGLDAAVMTSLAREMGHAPALADVAARAAAAVGRALGRDFTRADEAAIRE